MRNDDQRAINPRAMESVIQRSHAASTYIATASGGGFEVFGEVFSASKFMQESMLKTGGSGYGEIVDEILASMKGLTLNDARGMVIKYQSTDPASIRTELKQIITEAATIAAPFPEAEGYKKWILEMVNKVAETRTGGILGFGGTSIVDEKEKAALDELKLILGL